MKKLITVIVASLTLGIATGFLMFWLTYLNVDEGFEPSNPAATSDEIIPSK